MIPVQMPLDVLYKPVTHRRTDILKLKAADITVLVLFSQAMPTYEHPAGMLPFPQRMHGIIIV